MVFGPAFCALKFLLCPKMCSRSTQKRTLSECFTILFQGWISWMKQTFDLASDGRCLVYGGEMYCKIKFCLVSSLWPGKEDSRFRNPKLERAMPMRSLKKMQVKIMFCYRSAVLLQLLFDRLLARLGISEIYLANSTIHHDNLILVRLDVWNLSSLFSHS